MALGENFSRILVCDDQPDVCSALGLALNGAGYTVESYLSPAALLAAGNPACLMLLDMNYTRDTTSGEEGLSLIRHLRQSGNSTPIIAMTAWGDIPLAVRAMQIGANDFLEKPWHNDRLLEMAAKWHGARQQAKSELSAAREVQRGLLAKMNSFASSLDFACRFLPARELSGDYYDFFLRSDAQIGFLLADVSGKGTPAALLMANLQGLFRSHCANPTLSLEEILTAVNRLFYESSPGSAFASAFYAEFENSTGVLRFASCGHPPALLRRQSGEVLALREGGPILGAFPSWQGSSGRVQLCSGDRLLLYSDGASEATNPDGVEFGMERLTQWLRATGQTPPSLTLDELAYRLTNYAGPVLADDCTLVLAAVR